MKVLAFAVVLAWSAGVAAAPSAPVTTPPRVLFAPPPATVVRMFPKAALQAGVPGEVVLDCRVSRAGRLADCQVRRAAPEGMGFEQAAMEVAAEYRLSPLLVDGRPSDGGVVRLPIRFDLGGAAPAVDVDSSAGPQLCPDGHGCVVIE